MYGAHGEVIVTAVNIVEEVYNHVIDIVTIQHQRTVVVDVMVIINLLERVILMVVSVSFLPLDKVIFPFIFPYYGFKVSEDKMQSCIDVICLLYTSPSPRDKRQSRMPSSA